MNQTIDSFLLHMQASKGALPATISTYHESLTIAANFFETIRGAGTEWETLTTEDFRAWAAEQMQRGYSPSYVKKNMAALRSLYRYLLREGRVKVDPVRLVKNPKQQKRLPSFIRESEMDRLLDFYDFGEGYCGVRNRTILLLLYHTGIRAAELCALDLTDLDLPGESLRVTGKGNKQRVIPFGRELHDAFVVYLKERAAYLAEKKIRSPEPNNALFLSSQAHRLRYPKLRSIVNEALSSVTTQKRRSPHALRHSFATAMLAHGAQLEAIRQLLGHASVSTTAIYTHTTLAELKDQYVQAHPRNEK